MLRDEVLVAVLVLPLLRVRVLMLLLDVTTRL